MSKRLQVLLDEREWREIRRVARRQRMTVSEWVRKVLTAARRQEPLAGTGKKLEALKAATRHSFPSGDIQEILTEIERGYLGDRSS